MTAKNLKKSRANHGGRAIRAARSGVSSMKLTGESAPSKLSLVALNDIYIIEEDPLGINETGLSGSVESAIRRGALVIPEAYQDFATKFPCTGKVIAKGPQTKYTEIQIGTHVMFARLGVQRWKVNGKTICNCKEGELHGIILD